MKRFASISLSKLEALSLLLEQIVPSLGRLGSTMNTVSYEKGCELVWDCIDWSRIGRHLPYIRRVINDEFERAASARRIAQFDSRCERVKKWRYDKNAKRRIARRKQRIAKGGGWTVRQPETDEHNQRPKLAVSPPKRKPLTSAPARKAGQLPPQPRLKTLPAATRVKQTQKTRPGTKTGTAKSAKRPPSRTTR
jgi:hypothetical protein